MENRIKLTAEQLHFYRKVLNVLIMRFDVETSYVFNTRSKDDYLALVDKVRNHVFAKRTITKKAAQSFGEMFEHAIRYATADAIFIKHAELSSLR